jgi:type I restriction enzyme R subunit
MLWCNGFPLVVGEAKSPVRPARGSMRPHRSTRTTKKNVPMFVVPNVLNFATEGKDFRYGTVCMPVE